MKAKSLPFVLQALTAAIFFGASAPFAKLLLGDISPVYLAAFLYLGSGTGISLIKLGQKSLRPTQQIEASLKKEDVKWLAGAIISGGVMAPIVLMVSLKNTPASTTSLLLNFEGVGTTLLALFFFKEAISRKAWMAILVITLASVFLSTNFSEGFSPSLGAMGIILACLLWGLDNNLTRNISGKDLLVIVAWKGVAAGTFSFFLAFLLGNAMPSFISILLTMMLGFVSYGMSTILFILSMRGLGAARTSALYGTAPLAGVLLSIIIFGESPSIAYILAGFLMVSGALLLINEEHSHFHVHTATFHEHSHKHNDPAHQHDSTSRGVHSHEHEHLAEEHQHEHMPDIHHRHGHEK